MFRLGQVDGDGWLQLFPVGTPLSQMLQSLPDSGEASARSEPQSHAVSAGVSSSGDVSGGLAVNYTQAYMFPPPDQHVRHLLGSDSAYPKELEVGTWVGKTHTDFTRFVVNYLVFSRKAHEELFAIDSARLDNLWDIFKHGEQPLDPTSTLLPADQPLLHWTPHYTLEERSWRTIGMLNVEDMVSILYTAEVHLTSCSPCQAE